MWFITMLWIHVSRETLLSLTDELTGILNPATLSHSSAGLGFGSALC